MPNTRLDGKKKLISLSKNVIRENCPPLIVERSYRVGTPLPENTKMPKRQPKINFAVHFKITLMSDRVGQLAF